MAMGTRKHRQRQEQLWVTHTELAKGPGHPFYQRLNEFLDAEKFDAFAENLPERPAFSERGALVSLGG
jgi:hypothetical protein